MPLTKEQIIIETIEYYKNNPRAKITDETGIKVCQYYNEKGAMCAVGRCLKNPESYKEVDIGVSAYTLFSEYGMDILQEKYQGHEDTFWDSLQTLHDNDEHWECEDNKNFLSNDGYKKVKSMCNNYELNYELIKNSLYNDTTEMQLN